MDELPGFLIASFDHYVPAAQTERGGRKEKYGRRDGALLALLLESLQGGKNSEGYADKQCAYSTKAKLTDHRPPGRIRQ